MAGALFNAAVIVACGVILALSVYQITKALRDDMRAMRKER
jgi:hypothetical protein